MDNKVTALREILKTKFEIYKNKVNISYDDTVSSKLFDDNFEEFRVEKTSWEHPLEISFPEYIMDVFIKHPFRVVW